MDAIGCVKALYPVAILLVLSLIAYRDFKERRIPNRLLAVMLAIRCGYFMALCVLSRDFLFRELLDFVIGFSVFAFVGVLAYAFLQKSMGAGDIKLLITLGGVLGFGDAVSLTAITLVLALACLLIRPMRKQKPQSYPMAPFVWVSFVLLHTIKLL